MLEPFVHKAFSDRKSEITNRIIMPKLAVFPKAYMKALCKEGTMKLAQWIELASTLHVDGLEWYAGFLEMAETKNWSMFRAMVEDKGMVIPMLCYSPDFTHPDSEFRKKEVQKQKGAIDMAYALGASFCRVLSGQNRPDVTTEKGLQFAADCIEDCLPYAEERNITLILENHYKDDFWQYPEFALPTNIFCQLLDKIQHPFFGVNYDPSNVLLAGEEPLDLLKKVLHRIVTMHASDRYLKEGTIEDLRREEMDSVGYAQRLMHGEIGKGLIDYDAIFMLLHGAGFDGWISIEDGVDGFEQLGRSVAFVKAKMKHYWPSL